MHSTVSNGRSLAKVISTIKDEAREFASTRIQLLKAEIQQKLPLLKVAGLLAGIALMFLPIAFLLMTLALVALVATLLVANPYHWVLGFLAIGVLWAIVGGVAGYFAKRQFELWGILPRRTIEVLKGDKIWLQSEARDQL